MPNIKRNLTFLLLGVVSSTTVLAGNARYHQAKVMDVQPVYEVVRVPDRQKVCWNEEVVHHRHKNNAGGAIIGGILGGVVGNQFGKGNGKKAATVAGALLGGAIGHDVAKSNHRGHRYSTIEERCEIRNDYYEEERVTGYDVTYKFHGETYKTRTSYHPGDKIKVRVNVTPTL